MSFIVAIQDKKAEMWIKPYDVLNKQVAIRGFVQSFRANSGVAMLKDFPEDYELYVLAEFDETNMTVPLNFFNVPKLLMTGEEAQTMADMLDKRDTERSHYKASDN